MSQHTDQHVEAARFMKFISDQLDIPLDHLVFDYKSIDDGYQLELITINSVHQQSFLFHTTSGTTKIEALQAMVDYVKTHMNEESSFTIQWARKGDNALNTSYFRSGNIRDALDKFYHGQDPNAFVIFSVVLNPIA